MHDSSSKQDNSKENNNNNQLKLPPIHPHKLTTTQITTDSPSMAYGTKSPTTQLPTNAPIISVAPSTRTSSSNIETIHPTATPTLSPAVAPAAQSPPAAALESPVQCEGLLFCLTHTVFRTFNSTRVM